MRRRVNRKKKMVEPDAIAKEPIAQTGAVKKRHKTLNGAHYNTGPTVALSNILDHGATRVDTETPSALPQQSGKGNSKRVSAMGTSVSLQGRTDADFDGGSFATHNVRASAASGCRSCGEEGQCIRARGVLVARYHVTTTVTLPSVSDFPDLTPCQQARVQSAIDTVLAPHEQEHVNAFRQYNGVVRTPFDVTLCRSEFDAAIQSMFDGQESARQASAQAASDALDPFTFTVDIDCGEPPSSAQDDAKDEANILRTDVTNVVAQREE